MASTYITQPGDTWDLMAYKLYGAEKYMKNLAEANWPLLDILVFPSGTEITVPDLPGDEKDETSPFWRQDDDENEEDYSSTEDPDEEDDDDE